VLNYSPVAFRHHNLCIGIFLSNNFTHFTDNILIQNIWLKDIRPSCSMGWRSSLPYYKLYSRSKWSDWLQGAKFSWSNAKYGGLSEGGYLLLDLLLVLLVLLFFR